MVQSDWVSCSEEWPHGPLELPRGNKLNRDIPLLCWAPIHLHILWLFGSKLAAFSRCAHSSRLINTGQSKTLTLRNVFGFVIFWCHAVFFVAWILIFATWKGQVQALQVQVKKCLQRNDRHDAAVKGFLHCVEELHRNYHMSCVINRCGIPFTMCLYLGRPVVFQ